VSDYKFALDEDVAHAVASLLRYRGLNVDSAKELGRLGLTDPQVLLRAAEQQQTLVTHNRKDFRALHEAWILWRGRWAVEVEQTTGGSTTLTQHAGILIVPHMRNQELARIIEEFDDAAHPTMDRLFAWRRGAGWFEIKP